jgi:hypothetical protein
MMSNKNPIHRRPGNHPVVKALDRSVTTTWFSPTRDTEHRHPTRHRQDGWNDDVQLVERGFIKTLA